MHLAARLAARLTLATGVKMLLQSPQNPIDRTGARTVWWLFHLFVAAHIATGAVGLVLFWIPVIGRKGSATHRRIGDVFTKCILATGISAI